MVHPSRSPSLIEPGLVGLDVDLGEDAEAVVAGLARRVTSARGGDAEVLTRDAWWREQRSPTGMPGGFAIPHCRSAGVDTASLGFARLARPVHFGATDGPADIVFLIATPAGSGGEHLRLLARLARALVRPDFLAALRTAPRPEHVVEVVRTMVEPPVTRTEPGRRTDASMGHDPAGADPQSASHAGWWTRRRNRGTS